MKTTKLLATAISSFLLSLSAQAATIVKIDFGTSTSSLQSGFIAQNSGAATTYSTVNGDITVASTGSFFNRSSGSAYVDSPLLGDFTFLNSFGTMTITIAGPGIAPNLAHSIKFYSYDSQHTGGGGTVTYTGTSGTVGGTSITYSNSTQNTAGFADRMSSTSNWTSNNSGQIVINVTGTTEGPRVSGMEITVIPEPSAALLGGIGALLLLRRRK